MKKIILIVLSLLLVFSILSFGFAENPSIVIGATATPHAEILEFIKEDLLELGYVLEIVEFTGYDLANPALSAKELDANYFQHIPFLDDYNSDVSEANQLDAAIGVHYEPFGIYMGKSDSLENIEEGSVITIPNDPANETRALLLLQEAGLIKLEDDVNYQSIVTVLDIVDNPLKLDIREVEAATLPATLEDADFAVINGNNALKAGLDPADVVYVESSQGDTAKIYTNYIVVRVEDIDADFVKALKEAILSEKVHDFIVNSEVYKGGVVPAFEIEKSE